MEVSSRIRRDDTSVPGRTASGCSPSNFSSNALIAGVLLGGFYAAVSLGLTVSFGQLNIVNIAHPAFIILGSYIAYMCNSLWGLDPILTGSYSFPCSS